MFVIEETMNPPAKNPLTQLLGNLQFRWLLVGNTAMFFGFFGTLLLRSLLAWDITKDEMSLAYINLLAAICMFVVSIFSGTLIDRFERRRLLLLSQFAVFAAESLILVLLITGHISFGFLLFSSIAASVSFPFIMPARTAMLVTVVGKHRLSKATAMMTAGVNIARMISPALVGIFADVAGFAFCYGLLLALHGISLAYTFRLDNYPAGNSARESFFRETLKGFAYIKDNRSLGLCILFGVLPLMIVIPLQNLMVVFVEEIWHQGGSGLGIMMAAMGIGGVVGSLIMALIGENSLVKPMVYGTLVMGVFLLIFAHAANFWFAALMVLAIYSASVLSQTLVQTAVQMMAEDHIRGRITTITMMSISLAPMGTIPLAYATKHLGAPWSMTIAAVLLIVAVLVMWLAVPAFRRIDEVSGNYSR